MPVKRRVLLQGAIAATAIGGSVLAGRARRRQDSPATPSQEVQPPTIADDTRSFMNGLAARLSPLEIADETLLAFIHDHAQANGSFEWRNHRVPHKVAQRLLLSTNFFQRGADPRIPLLYVRYYDPYISTCYNPIGTG